jgi:hypothetical protein
MHKRDDKVETDPGSDRRELGMQGSGLLGSESLLARMGRGTGITFIIDYCGIRFQSRSGGEGSPRRRKGKTDKIRPPQGSLASYNR